MLSPSNVFVSKVSGTQSDATYYHPEQDIIETQVHVRSRFLRLLPIALIKLVGRSQGEERTNRTLRMQGRISGYFA